MTNAYKRKKQPEQVRRALLDQAVKITLERGLSAVTIQSVADAAGVTKGGFLHHFPSKQLLIDAVYQELVDDAERELNDLMTQDPEPYGSFTRAYVTLTGNMLSAQDALSQQRAALSMLTLTDPQMRERWAEWFNSQLVKHKTTDSHEALTLVRLAADGLWLAELSDIDLPPTQSVIKRLLSMTHPD